MRELRRIMEQQKSLPVLYNTTYDDFAKLLKEQGEADAEMLQQLRRTTMVQHLNPGEPVLFRQNVCFAVLRRLATVCCPKLMGGGTPGDVFFVMRVRNAVKHVCSDEHFTELRGEGQKGGQGVAGVPERAVQAHGGGGRPSQHVSSCSPAPRLSVPPLHVTLRTV